MDVVYKVGDTTLATDASNSVTLATEASDGATAIANKFTVTPNASDNQIADRYKAELTVTITAG